MYFTIARVAKSHVNYSFLQLVPISFPHLFFICSSPVLWRTVVGNAVRACRKVFKKLNFELSEDVIESLVQCRSGTVERVLLLVRTKIDRRALDPHRVSHDRYGNFTLQVQTPLKLVTRRLILVRLTSVQLDLRVYEASVHSLRTLVNPIVQRIILFDQQWTLLSSSSVV